MCTSMCASLYVNMQFNYHEIKDMREGYDKDYDGFDWYEFALCSLWALSNTWGFFNPLYLATGGVIISYYVEAIKDTYRHIVSSFDNDKNNISSTINLGFEVTSLLESVNKAVAPFYVIIYFLELVVLTVSTYTFFDVVPRSNDLKWIFGVDSTPVMQMLTSIWGLCIFSAVGQSLEDERNKCKGALEIKVTKFTKKQERMHGKKAAMLLRQMDRAEVLSPYGMFNVNNSSAVSTIATTITYIIVLLQFKQSEAVNGAVEVTGEIDEDGGDSPTIL